MPSIKVILMLTLVFSTVVICNDSEFKLEGKNYAPATRSGTRSFSNIFQEGLSEGMFKYAYLGKEDCTAEGMKLTRATIGAILRARKGGNQDDVKNTIMLAEDVFKKCNYVATV